MFYSIKVPKVDSNFLRFFWYTDSDLNSEPVQFRLTVHVFGAKSSPSCANFALKQCIEKEHSGDLLGHRIFESFYVDDCMLSANSEDEAISIVRNAQCILSDNGFNLTGFASNSRHVLAAIPPDKLSKEFKACNDLEKELPIQRALGLLWNAQSDHFCFEINVSPDKLTKRGILSTIFSIYDPLFLISPALVLGKHLFQEACKLELEWDEPLPPALATPWKGWLNEVKKLHHLQIPRCYDSQGYSNVELHIFADGSQLAYGCVAYLRFENATEVKCTLAMAKVRLVPLKKGSLKTIPRIELNAAKLAVILFLKLDKELNLPFRCIYFWSDSSIVLSYIYSNDGRFQRFVANRIAFIRNHTSVNNWRHVPGNLNPCDILSRGITNAESFRDNVTWFHGPQFLYESVEYWPRQLDYLSISSDDEERIHHVKCVVEANEATELLLCSSSNWHNLKCKVAVFTRLKDYLKNKSMKSGRLTVDELNKAELHIWQYLQQKYFRDEYNHLRCNRNIPAKSFLRKLSPFLDDRGVMRVGGRLGNSNLSNRVKHPILIPKQAMATELLIKSLHRSLGHLGRKTLTAHLKLDYHIVGISSIVKSVLRKCLICRKVQGKPSTQFMADLPKERVIGDLPPFSNSGVDFFGPFLITKGRKSEKRYGVIFSCLTTRACHVEVSVSLDTDSFLNSLRRFIARRGPIIFLISDNGTNLVSGCKELKASVNEWNGCQIGNFCTQQNIEWTFNPPHASHFGGVYEREIRTIRKVFNSLMLEFSNKVRLTDEMLQTLMCEVENILNSRPLTAVTTDSGDLEALTPNHLLRLNSTFSFPPGLFSNNDCYTKRRWRQIQYMADRFWTRWRKEYVPLLRERQKWYTHQREHRIGDLVLVVDQVLPRNMWCMGRIIHTEVKGNHVRFAKVKVSRYKEGKALKLDTTVLERPINKLILLVPVEELD